MKKALYKDIYREMKKTRARVLSIFLMSALGVAFFAGVRASEQSMLVTTDAYLDTYSLCDLRLINTLGFDEEGIRQIEAIPGVDRAEGTQMAYLMGAKDGSEDTFPIQLFAASKELTQVEIKQGRLPKAEDELLIDARLARQKGIGLGDLLTFSTGTEQDIEDTLVTETFRVVGFANSPMFISLERGSTTIGNGAVAGYAVAAPEAFASEYYSMVYVTAEGAEELLCYSEEYESLIAELKERIEAAEESLGHDRYDRLQTTIEEQLADAEAELAEQEQKANEELDDAWQKLQEAAEKLADGRKEIEDGEKELEDGKKQLADGEAQLLQARAELEAARTQVSSGQMMLTAGEVAIQSYQAQLAGGEATLKMLKALYPSGLISIDSIDQQIADTEAQLNEAKAQLLQAQAEMENYRAQIAAGEAQMKDGQAQIEAGQKEIEENRIRLQEAEVQLAEGRAELEKGEEEYRNGLQEYEDGKAEAEEKIADAKQQLAEAREKTADLEEPDWYLFDRADQVGYSSMQDNAGSIGAIGKVFPLIFFLVAALVSLTTMTRMVEEQRTQIGTMKALGYSRLSIAMKYLIYAMSTTIAGSVVGILIGQKFFPWVIITAFGIMFTVNSAMTIPYQWGSAALAAGAVILCNLAATLASCMKSFRSMPAALMRPEAPKEGQRVFLEYVPFLWKHLNFTRKASIRNLFRYKKRFFMTLFGIGGCMALLVVGWGMRDSIVHIADTQYDQIQLYDGMLIVNTDAPKEEQQALYQELTDRPEIGPFAPVYMKTVDIASHEDTVSGYICVTNDPENFEKVNVLTGEDGTAYSLDDSGAILTAQMARLLGVEPGDTFYIQSGTEKQVEARVSAVVQNYILHYVYLTENYYKELYGESPEFSTIQYAMEEEYASAEKEIGEELLTNEAAYAISYVSGTRNQIESMLQAMNLVVLVLIVSAGMLAYVVLYNLNNINITERRRELATLKVLGFYDREVSSYVYRENVILTLLGIGIGIFLGIYLHHFIIGSLKIDLVSFSTHISLLSYAMSALLTIVFALFVNYIMYHKLREIDMVESLKSVE